VIPLVISQWQRHAEQKIGMSDTHLIVFTALNVLGNTLSSIALLVFQQARPFYDISSMV